jgi:DNA-cytosine methyltransferase
MEKMTYDHVDLFSGIGGFSLGLERAGFKTVVFCEQDKFCHKVLNKNFPGVPIEPDIKTFDGTKYAGAFILTGGFPCQPFSCAGKRKGAEDDRALWPEMFRVIQEVRPRWIIGENVAGFIGMGLDSCISDLEREGYAVQAFIIPACAVNAPHRRDRVWIVGHSEDTGIENVRREREDAVFQNADVTNSTGRENNGRNRRSVDTPEERGECSDSAVSVGDKYVTDAEKSKREQSGRTRAGRQGFTDGSSWDEPWIEVARRFCVLDARVSDRLVRYSLTLPETNGIMGFILMLRRYHYATSKEARAREVLPILQEAFAEEQVQRCFGRLSEIFEAENLWCPLHGKIDSEGKENEIGISERSCEVPGGIVREVRSDNNLVNSPQGRGLDKQCTCQFDDIVFELSSEIALGEWKRNSEKAENILFNLWKESGGERFLHEPLSALYEIWRSVTDQEIGAFRRHYNMRDKDRVNRLKALGNAVVPQIPEILGREIMGIENGR